MGDVARGCRGVCRRSQRDPTRRSFPLARISLNSHQLSLTSRTSPRPPACPPCLRALASPSRQRSSPAPSPRPQPSQPAQPGSRTPAQSTCESHTSPSPTTTHKEEGERAKGSRHSACRAPSQRFRTSSSDHDQPPRGECRTVIVAKSAPIDRRRWRRRRRGVSPWSIIRR